MTIKRFWMVILAMILAMSLGLSVSAATVPAAAAKAMNRYIVTLTGEDSVARGRIQALVRIQQGKILHEYQIIPALAVELPETAAAALARDPAVLRLEPDAIARIAVTELENSWGVDHIEADLTWPEATGAGVTGAGIDVAVIDTGIDAGHPDLAGSVVAGRSFLNNGSEYDSYADDNGHGTHVAGTIGARANDAGVIGVAPQVSFFVAKVLDSSGSGYYSDIIAGINWATQKGVDVINMSLGGTADVQAMEDAVNAAYAANILVVAAAGNEGGSLRRDTVIYPAKYDSVVAVAATDSADVRASFSSTGPAVEIAAPGVGIMSTIPGGGYASWSGTSMATPHVAGTAALLKAANPTATAPEIRTLLQQMADDLGSAGRDVLYGFGLVDAHIGTGTVEPPPPPPPPQEPLATVTSVDTDKDSYKIGEKVAITVHVTGTDGTQPIAGAAVVVLVTSPKNKAKALSGTTDASGLLTVTYSTNKTSPLGLYAVVATTADNLASDTPYTGSAGTCSFTLTK